MSYIENKELYLNLCRKFLADKIKSKEFEKLYYEQWRTDRDSETDDSYKKSQEKDCDKKFVEVVNKIFTGLDVCCHEGQPDHSMGEITVEELKQEIRNHLKILDVG